MMNLLAVAAAAASSFAIGGAWYSPKLFGTVWNREDGRADKTPEGNRQQGHPAKVFAASFTFALIAATLFGWWLGPSPPLAVALQAGLVAGSGFAATSFGINYQFAGRSFKLWLIDGGYHTVQFLMFGAILGLWH
jgi:hypothetical protein